MQQLKWNSMPVARDIFTFLILMYNDIYTYIVFYVNTCTG